MSVQRSKDPGARAPSASPTGEGRWVGTGFCHVPSWPASSMNDTVLSRGDHARSQQPACGGRGWEAVSGGGAVAGGGSNKGKERRARGEKKIRELRGELGRGWPTSKRTESESVRHFLTLYGVYKILFDTA